MKKFFQEFKKFITRGNVMDLAVGVIVGAAFISSIMHNKKQLQEKVKEICENK